MFTSRRVGKEISNVTLNTCNTSHIRPHKGLPREQQGGDKGITLCVSLFCIYTRARLFYIGM